MKPKAICLLSGGMDSTVALACAIRDGFDPWILHVSYGQRTEKRERQAMIDIVQHYDIDPTHVLALQLYYFSQIGGNALTDYSIDIPEDGIEPGVPVTYVPFRNGNILSIAVSWAEAIRAKTIYIGVVEEDSSGYPDCRLDFVESFLAAARAGTRPDTLESIVAPLIKLSKSEIVLLGKDLQVPFELTWSCYQGNDVACGVCDSCRLRLKGFKEAGIIDPIIYKDTE